MCLFAPSCEPEELMWSATPPPVQVEVCFLGSSGLVRPPLVIPRLRSFSAVFIEPLGRFSQLCPERKTTFVIPVYSYIRLL